MLNFVLYLGGRLIGLTSEKYKMFFKKRATYKPLAHEGGGGVIDDDDDNDDGDDVEGCCFCYCCCCT